MKNKRAVELVSMLVVALMLAAFLSCTQTFSLAELADGPDGKALTVSPTASQIQIDDSILIETTGGIPPYTYTITSGAGTIVDNVFTASAITGTVTIRIEDKVGSIQESVLTVVNALYFDPPDLTADVDYYVSTPPVGGTSVALGDPISATFIVTNQGSDAGSATVYWTAYVSTDAIFNVGDSVVDSGNLAALAATGNSGIVTIDNGSWDTAGNWYLLIRLLAADERNTANNLRASTSAYSVLPESPTQADYRPGDITMYSPFVTSGSPVQESFNLVNIGSDGTPGVNVTWTAYASLDAVLDTGEDSVLGTGFVGPLGAGGILPGIPLLGASWPAVQGDYFLIVKTEAADESPTGDYTVSAGTFTLSSPPDYVIQSVTYPPSAEAGTAVSGGFTIRNTGTGKGTKILSWEVFLSYDPGLSGDDLSIGSGTSGPLTAGGMLQVLPTELDYENWPNYGRCYVLIRIQADDDSDTTNNSHLSAVTELFVYDSEGPARDGPSNDGHGPSVGPISPAQSMGTLEQGQTLVVKGWVDLYDPLNTLIGWDTYSFTIGAGVSTVSSYAIWTPGVDICYLYYWDESGLEKRSQSNGTSREPDPGFFTEPLGASGATAYVSVYSRRQDVVTGAEYPYTLYLKGD
jgi:hypothetical protein